MTDQKKILVFNWRDIKNPTAGGAEKYIHEILRRLVGKGHDITLLTSVFKECKMEEIIDGVKIIRRGGKYSVYHKTKKYYLTYLKENNYDLIIDSINTIPFFTPNFAKDEKIISIIYQLAREFWFYETVFPINFIGYHFLERIWLSKYKDIPVITISDSTKKDLVDLGFERIYEVPIGISVRQSKEVNTGENNSLLFIGRLTKAKKPFDIIKAFSLILNKFPNYELLIIGRGYLEKQLKDYCKILGCRSKVKFLGFLSEEDKIKKIKEAKLLLVAGIREGWGIVVTEANAYGVPAIGYNIPGLRDSIINGKTGFLSELFPDKMAKRIIEFLDDKDLQNSFIINALNYSRGFSWDKSASKFEKILLEISKT